MNLLSVSEGILLGNASVLHSLCDQLLGLSFGHSDLLSLLFELLSDGGLVESLSFEIDLFLNIFLAVFDVASSFIGLSFFGSGIEYGKFLLSVHDLNSHLMGS